MMRRSNINRYLDTTAVAMCRRSLSFDASGGAGTLQSRDYEELRSVSMLFQLFGFILHCCP